MSEEIGGEIVPDSTRELEIDNEVDLMIEDLDLWYGNKQALYGVSLPIAKNSVTALIGPSGCCLLYTSPSPRDQRGSGMPASA